MPPRTLHVDGQRWEVGSSGRVTQYALDEFSVQFRRLDGPPEIRVSRYSPLGARSPDASLAELTERQLLELFRHSQPSWTAPEAGYRR